LLCSHQILFYRQTKRRRLFLSDQLHPQTVSVVQTRADSLGLTVELGNVCAADFSNRDVAGVIFQYPDTEGSVYDFSEVVQTAHSNGVSYNKHMRKQDVYNESLFLTLT